MNTAPVSVVIPSFNAGRFVTQAVDSVLAQTVVPAEIIVVDDGSVDETRQLLEPYSDKIRYLYQDNQGVSTARNLGMANARQEYIAFLDADDVWHPSKIELQMRVLSLHPELGMLSTQEFPWPAEKFPTIDSPGSLTFAPWSRLVVRNYLNTSSIVVRRPVQVRAGLFDRTIQGPEDRDLWLRIAEIAPVASLELPLMGYRNVPGSLSKQAARCQEGMLRILEKLDERNVWQGRRLLRRKAYSHVYHACSYIHGAAGDYRSAIGNEFKSLFWYPFPYGKDVSPTPFARMKRLLVDLLRLFHLKTPDPAALMRSPA
jgi:glycosyltransferase involved in cell wall biosynthesis